LAPVIAARAQEIERRRELSESLHERLIEGGFSDCWCRARWAMRNFRL
jgi:hypothetical protein